LERRSLYQIIFGQKQQKQQNTYTQLKMLQGYQPTFSTWSGSAYDSDVVRACVDSIARHAAKLRPKHIRRMNGEIQAVNSTTVRLLQTSPNPYMSAYDFFYKLVSLLMVKNNAFVYVDYDPMGNPKAFYPIDYSQVEFLEPRTGKPEIIAKFQFNSGQTYVLPYTELIHLRRFYFDNDLFGSSNDKAINPTLELIQTSNEGIINAVKQSAFLRGLLKYTNILKAEDMKAAKDKFVEDYLTVTNQGGIAAIDNKADYVELKNEPKMVDAKQMELIDSKVYRFFGVNEKIVKSNFSEEEFGSFYESVIEPLAIQMSLAFTNQLFSNREQGFGNEIIFEGNRLQYASNQTKLQFLAMVDRGAMTPNEWREIFNWAPVEGGDQPVRRLDTATIGGEPNGQGTQTDNGDQVT